MKLLLVTLVAFQFSTPVVFACKDSLVRIGAGSIALQVTPENKVRVVLDREKTPVIRVAQTLLNAAAQPIALKKTSRMLGRIAADNRPVSIYQKAADAFRIKTITNGLEPNSIPKEGALLVISNHPLSGIEGMAIAATLAQQRPDVKVVLNDLLTVIPGISEAAFAIDVANPKSRENIKALRDMQQWLNEGHTLLIFPAGDVSRKRYGTGNGDVADGPWKRSIVSLTKKSGANVLPIFVHGKPGFAFNALDRAHPKLASSFVPLEILRQEGSTVKLTIGSPIESSRVIEIADENEAVEFLRRATYSLRE